MVLWGWALLASGAITLVLLTYRFIWLERYRFPFRMAAGAVRLRGRVLGQIGEVVYCVDADGEQVTARPFTLECVDEPRQLVAPLGAVLDVRAHRHRRLGRLRGIMVGDRVTIDGIPATLRREESLYREAGRVPVVEAIRIAGGSWPELRWLRFPMAAGALIFMLSLGQILFSPAEQRHPFALAPAAVQIGHEAHADRWSGYLDEEPVFADDFFSPWSMVRPLGPARGFLDDDLGGGLAGGSGE